MAMADESVGNSASRKLHPLFVKHPAFANPEQTTFLPTTTDEEREPKRVKTDNHTPPQRSDYLNTLPTYCNHPRPDAAVSSQQFQQPPGQPLDRLIVHQRHSMMSFVNAPPPGSAPLPYFPVSRPSAPSTNGGSCTMPENHFIPPSQPALPVDYAETPKARAPLLQAPTTQASLPMAPAHHLNDSAQPPLSESSTNQAAPVAATPQEKAPLTKVLMFNKGTGTLGSPPKPKPPRHHSRIVLIKYGQNAEDRKRISDKICRILSGQLRIEPTSKGNERKPRKTKERLPQAAVKTTHPFFAKEPRPEPQMNSEKKRNTVFMATPVSPRKPRNGFTSTKGPSFGVRSSGTKVPGAKHPLWPPHGFSHIRGTEQLALSPASVPVNRLKKKSKGQTVSITSHESVLGLLSRRLNVADVKSSLPKNDNLFTPPPDELRLPTRHFESGPKLARRIRSEIRTKVPSLTVAGRDPDEDDLAQEPSEALHPIIERHWQALARQLSAFDQSTCESMSWVTKYAPARAAEVLQPGREVALLKQWLEMLRVQGVESAADGSAKSKGEPKKKKRKSKLDGFIVDSEDESGEMNELSDLEDQPPNAKRRSRPSVVRSLDLAGKDPSKLANTILISGPHGSGKSASVYAVAKELGFEVFEINSSTRRSGKDILERVGDMTRNHLVQHHRTETLDSAEVTGSETDAGKQGMMTSFFKPKAAAERKKKYPDKARADADGGPRNPSAKSQKQSLILLEEVDILFEEDKQFWASLQSLMTQSKRPFILTCNDESAVPMNTLNLHGIFRFLPPSEHLAVDTCLLIAANEGHALKRDAVQALYRCRDYDLRGTITDLQFWCQIGVGDRRGGHDWFYQRWPKGVDLDKQGQVVRVISGDTYQTGMGWLSRDRLVNAPNTQLMEQEAAEQAWQFWRRDLSDSHGPKDLNTMSAATSAGCMSRKQRLRILEAYTDYYDTLSCADICAAGVLGADLDEMLDPTRPGMPVATRDDFTIAQALLEADPLEPHFCSRVAISSALSTFALGILKKSALGLLPSASVASDGPYGEHKTTAFLADMSERDNRKLTRYDVAVAFDPIAVSPKAVASMSLDPSVFDRTMTMIVVEVAPWVRGIVHYDDQLMQDRQRLSELLGEGGRRKRMRTTRSAYSALEGGERRTTRKERYFGDCLSTEAVMHTAGRDWQHAVPLGERLAETDDDLASSPIPVESTGGVTLGM
ncbi:hypothetical protein V2A60_005928 [Cordyceps javanica]